jgi:hypothetical protein
LVVIGYSLPPSDYLVRALFRADLNPTRLTELLVVDPSSAVADRFVQLLRGPPRKIMTFSSFEEFARYLPAI